MNRLLVLGIFISTILNIWLFTDRGKLIESRDKYQQNTETLLADIRQYKLDSTRSATESSRLQLTIHGFVENKELVISDIDKALREPTDKRIFVISKAFRAGYTIDQVHELTKIDKWFLQKLMNIMKTSEELHSWGNNHKQIADLCVTRC